MERLALLGGCGGCAAGNQEISSEDPKAAGQLRDLESGTSPAAGSALDAEALQRWRPQESWASWIDRRKQQALRSVAAVTGHRIVAGALERITAASFASRPLSEALVIHEIYHSHHPWWAGIALFFALLPYLALTVTIMRGAEYRDAFARAFGFPAYVPGGLMFLDYKIIVKELLGIRRLPAEDTYIKLCRMFHSTFGSVPWTFFQIYIAIRQQWFDVHVVNPMLVPINVGLAMHTLFSSWDYFKTYAEIATGGNKSDFLRMHLILGRGAAPPSLLQQLRTREKVVVTDDLSKLEITGLRSVFLAIRQSKALRECHFEGTGIDTWYVEKTADCKRKGKKYFKPSAFWKHCMRDLVMNRERLQLVKFSPALEIPEDGDHYDYSAALSVCVLNGDRLVHAGLELTPLVEAILADNFGKCMEQGEEATSKDRILAARLGRWRALAGLLAQDPSRAEREPNLLHFAAMEGALSCTQLLLYCKADPTVPSEEGLLPACAAAKNGKADVLRLLLDSGASVNALQTKSHRINVNPIYESSNCDSEACAKLLVEARADVNIEVRYKEKPLHGCANYHAVKVARVLLAARADVNAVDTHNATPMHYAAREGATELVRTLLQAKTDPSLMDKLQRTPLTRAKERNQEDCMELLSASLANASLAAVESKLEA